jgi:hypothetical protein
MVFPVLVYSLVSVLRMRRDGGGGKGQRTDQPPGLQIAAQQARPGQCQAQTIDRGLDRQIGVAEAQAADGRRCRRLSPAAAIVTRH